MNVILCKKQNEMKKKNLKFEILYKNHSPTCHLKYKRIDFAPCNKPFMANRLLSTKLERFLRRIKPPLTQ